MHGYICDCCHTFVAYPPYVLDIQMPGRWFCKACFAWCRGGKPWSRDRI